MADQFDQWLDQAYAATQAPQKPSFDEWLEQAHAATQQPGPGRLEALGRGAAQGATMGFGDELVGAAKAYLSPESIFGQAKRADLYRKGRDENRAGNAAAEKAHGGYYLGGQVFGGLATAMVPGAAPATLGKAVAIGTGLGAASGLGGSEADLTKGDVQGAAVDTAVGAGLGVAGGVAGHEIAKVASAASNWLREAGQSRLFKAAVGQTKRAYTKINGRGLLEKAGEYLDSMGIGIGDSTESIAGKLGSRERGLNDALDATVSQLDGATGGTPMISGAKVADEIEKKVATPLKRLVANRDEHAQVMREVEEIRKLGDLSFTEAAAQRRAVQGKINYDKKNGLEAAAEAKNEIAKIWNSVIDEHAEPLLQKAGKDGDAYRELRHEYSLVKELLDHSRDRVAGNSANRWASPSDYGAGAIGTMIGGGNPLLGLAAATANHLARVYGNAAAGRAAINMARAGAMSPKALSLLPPAIARAMAPKGEPTAPAPEAEPDEPQQVQPQYAPYSAGLRQ